MGDKGRKIALGLGLLSVTSTLSPLLPVGGTAPEGWAAQSSAEGGGTVLPLGLEEPGRQVSDPGLGPHLPLTGGDPGAQGSPASSLGVTCLAGPAGQRWTERARPCARPAGPRPSWEPRASARFAVLEEAPGQGYIPHDPQSGIRLSALPPSPPWYEAFGDSVDTSAQLCRGRLGRLAASMPRMRPSPGPGRLSHVHPCPTERRHPLGFHLLWARPSMPRGAPLARACPHPLPASRPHHLSVLTEGPRDQHRASCMGGPASALTPHPLHRPSSPP